MIGYVMMLLEDKGKAELQKRVFGDGGYIQLGVGTVPAWSK